MYSLKKFFLRWIKKQGYQLSKLEAGNGTEINPLYYLSAFFIREDYKGDLIQIGANDGVTNDPVRKIILDFKIPSLLIEPQPEIFKMLKTAYNGVPGVRFENCAVDKADGTKELFFVRPGVTGYPAWATGIASFDKQTLLKHRRVLPDLENNLGKADVPAFTFTSLLKRHGIDSILLLQLDTEGYDFELLKDIIGLGFIPKLIQYEHKHLSFSDQAACRRLLSEKGYSFLSRKEDTIAIHKDQSVSTNTR